MAKVERYIPSIGDVNWDINKLSKEERNNLRNRIVMGTVHSEREYQEVIGYMYSKFPHLMDISGSVKNPLTGEYIENTSIQWNYTPYKYKRIVHNDKDTIKNNFNMYAFIYYDKERNFEPICFAGSYFKRATINVKDLIYENEFNELNKLLSDKGINLSKNSEIDTAIGEGYVMFCDPSYRRLGLGNFSWNAEAQLYRDCMNSKHVNDAIDMILPLQMEIQNHYSVKSTISCFPPTNKYPSVEDIDQLLFGEHSKHLFITSNGRVKNNGERCQIRLIMNYNDENMISTFNSMPENMKEIYNKPHYEWLERESKYNNMSIDEYRNKLILPWQNK